MKLENTCRSKSVKAAIIMMAVIVAAQFFFTIGINVTDSIPKKVFLIIKGITPEVGDFVAFRFQGSRYYKKGRTFIKVVAGNAGDFLEIKGRCFLLNQKLLGCAKEKDREGRPVESFTFSGKIPQDKIFVLGISKDSYDSRYYGFVDKSQIIGRAVALF